MTETPDELAAACDRLRRVKAGESIADVYAVDMPHHAGNAWLCDQAMLADAYLAERDATVKLRCGYILGVCRSLEEAQDEARYILEVLGGSEDTRDA